MDKERKYFLAEDSQLNSDDAPFVVSQNSWINGENFRVRTTDAGVTGTVECIGGTLLLSEPLPSITFLTIGAAEEEERSRFCEFKCCVSGPWHRIVCLDAILNQELVVLLSSQVIGGLNFDKNHLIHSTRIVDGLLYWTDALNDQRKINIDAAIKMNNPSYVTDVLPYVSPVDPTVITLLRKNPLYTLTFNKVTQPSLPNNFISIEAFQFSYYYHYRDGEDSVLANYSLLAPYNLKTDTFNRIDISIPFNEIIAQDVQQINLALRYGNTPNFFVIKNWSKSVPAELAQIQAHNAGVTQLSYSFYNDQIGNALSSAFSVKPFDSVPIISETLEIARERLFLGNNVEGYTTPGTTSLQANFVVQPDGTVTGNIYRFFFEPYSVGTPKQRWGLLIPMVSPTQYYIYPPGTTDSPPSPTDFTTLDAPVDLYTYFGVDSSRYMLTITFTGNSRTIINSPSPGTLAGLLCYKSASPYRLAIQFYDFGDRKSGLISNGTTYQTPDRAYSTVAYTSSLDWTLSNANAINEIPIWATHYAPVRTKCLRTSFFEQARVANLAYATKDTDGTYLFTTAAYSTDLNGVGVEITRLNNFGMGYVFADGDIIKIYISGDPTVHQLRILAQQDNWVVGELQDLGALTQPFITALFEIFTPYYQSFNEAFYEVGFMYAVSQADTISRNYSVLGGSIRGDVVILDRTGYLTEAMSGNDTYYKNWYTDAGRPCFVDTLGQKLKTNSVVWSNVYIPGSNNNGLSSFDVLDEKLMPIECGPLEKLQSTSKVSDELGLVILAIFQKETASLYIGESQLMSTIGNAFIAQSPEVIGTVNVLKGSYGTMNPESVSEFRGNVFWFDAGNGKVIQYGANGLYPISNYKMTRFWKLFSDQYLSMSVEEIEALGSRPFIFSTIDPHHLELLFSIPKLLANPPKGYTPDYPDMVFPFDIWDGRGKTIVYKLDYGEGRPIWMNAFKFNPEYFITLQNKLYSFKYGHIYIHNQVSNPNEFYGVQYSTKIMVVANKEANIPKVYDNVASESNLVPSFVYLFNNYPIQQSSDLVDLDFRPLEGVFYTTVKRNKLVPTATGYTTDGLLTGEKMRNTSMWIMFEWRIDSVYLELKFLNIGYTKSLGYNL